MHRRRTRRTAPHHAMRVALPLALAAGAPVPAAAAPVDAPVAAPVPAHIGSADHTGAGAVPTPAQRITWSAVPMTRCRSYGVEITDLDTGRVREHEVLPAVGRAEQPTTPEAAPPTELRFGPQPYDPRDATNVVQLQDGHRYVFRIRGIERSPGTAPAPWITGPFDNCRATDVGAPEPGPYGPATTPARYDDRAPSLVAVLAGGAAVTRATLVPVDVPVLADPDPPGVPGGASGVAALVIDGGERTLRQDGRYAVRLAGADGRRRVEVSARDAVGHTTTTTLETVLDRRAPVVRLRQAAPRVPVGAVAAFDASPTADPLAADGTSAGVRPGSFRWRFGDGLPGAITPSATHVFTRRGVMCGEVTVRDRAGNVGRRTFATRVASGTAVLGAVRRRGGVVEVCVARRATVTLRVTRPGAPARARRARGGPGLVRV
ncbi:MAG TPA: PKD domain-containing protein, partial [Miltoncostaeaceae bacterium]|nr:PKD domain-containing protein [Miltoncostaeaceae bacterium]